MQSKYGSQVDYELNRSVLGSLPSPFSKRDLSEVTYLVLFEETYD